MAVSGSSSSAGRWLLLVLMLGASGWASFTLYERTTSASVSADTLSNPRVEQLVTEAYKHLAVDELEVAREKLNQAAGLAEADPRVQEGLVLVAVRSAERVWLQHRLTEKGARDKHLDELDHAVHAARELIAIARRKTTDPPTLERIGMAERQLNTLLVLAFTSDDKNDRARGVVGARLTAHPQHGLLSAYVGSAAAPPPAASSSGATTPATASAPPVAPPPPTWGGPQPQPYYNPQPYEPHYELDHEPAMKGKPKTTGELEIPVPAPAPDPAPE